MTGSESRVLQKMMFAIIDYYANNDVTEDLEVKIKKIMSSGCIECNNSIDDELISIQDEYIKEKNHEKRNEIIFRFINEIK